MSILKKLASCLGEYKKHSILAPILVSFEVALEVLIPYVMAKLIDVIEEFGKTGYVQTGNEWQTLLKYSLILLVCAFAAMYFGVQAGNVASTASCGLAKNMRKRMYYSVQNFAFSNIDKFSTSSLISRMTTDVTNIQFSYQMICRSVIRAPLMIIFSLIFTFTIDYRLALIFVAVIPFLLLGLIFIAKKSHPWFESVFNTYDKLNETVQENVRGIRVVKSFTREKYETEKFKTVSEKIRKDFSVAEKIVAFNSPLMQSCLYGCLLLISYIGARLITTNQGMTTGDLTSVFTYSSSILMSLMIISMVYVMVLISKTSAERVCEVLDEVPDIVSPKDAITEVKDGSIDFNNVSFAYSNDSNNLALKDVNLHIDSGEVIGIIGGTGSSKSTLVQLIPRLFDVTSGEVKVGGVNVKDYDLTALRDNCSFVLQQNELFLGTIKENLRWGNKNATDEEMINACKIACADEFIEQLPDKYDTLIEQGGRNVSGGQKQRLCIARAILKNPKILVLDDSTSAVDTKTDKIIRQGFRTLIPTTTKIIIAQRILSIQDADRIVVMNNGQIVGVGTHEELLKTNTIYQEVYNSQSLGGEQNA